MPHFIGGQILEYSESLGRLVPAGNVSFDDNVGAPLRRKPVATPAQRKAAATAAINRRKALAAARAKQAQDARAKRAAALAAAKAKRAAALATAKANREKRLQALKEARAKRAAALAAAKAKRAAAKKNVPTVTKAGAAARILKPKGVARAKGIYAKAKKGDKRSIAQVAKLRKIAANKKNPAKAAVAQAAITTMQVEHLKGAAQLDNLETTPPQESIHDAISKQSEAIEEGQESAFVGPSDAAPEDTEAEDMAEDPTFATEEEAEARDDAEAFDEAEAVDEEVTEAAEDAMEDEGEPSEVEASADDEALGGSLSIASEMGWSPGRALRKAGKAVGKTAAKAGKAAANVALAPIKLQIAFARKFALPLARVFCRLPPDVIRSGAALAGVNPQHVALFCVAVRARNMSQITKLMPVVLKVSVKLAAQGAAPPLVPILAVIQRVPGPIKRAVFGKAVASALSGCACV